MKRLLLISVVLALATSSAAQQTRTSISNLPPAATPLTGNELVPIVQDGATRRVPVLALFSSTLVAPAQLPAFVGGDCFTAAGQVSISCGSSFGRLATANTWQLQQTFALPPVLQGLTGYLKGNGSSALSAVTQVVVTDLGGTFAQGDLAGSTGQKPQVLPAATRGSFLFKTSGGATGALACTNVGDVPQWTGASSDPICGPPGAVQIPPVHYAGQMIMMAGTNCPSGSLPGDGSSYSPTTYPQLYAYLGTTWGGSSSAPLLPDTRGQFIRGWGSGQTVDSGRAFGSAQVDALQNHTHGGVNNTASLNQFASSQGSGSNVNAGVVSNSTGGISTGNSASETRPKNITATFCIFTANSP